jgi:hypothetical protein
LRNAQRFCHLTRCKHFAAFLRRHYSTSFNGRTFSYKCLRITEYHAESLNPGGITAACPREAGASCAKRAALFAVRNIPQVLAGSGRGSLHHNLPRAPPSPCSLAFAAAFPVRREAYPQGALEDPAYFAGQS